MSSTFLSLYHQRLTLWNYLINTRNTSFYFLYTAAENNSLHLIILERQNIEYICAFEWIPLRREFSLNFVTNAKICVYLQLVFALFKMGLLLTNVEKVGLGKKSARVPNTTSRQHRQKNREKSGKIGKSRQTLKNTKYIHLFSEF